MLSVGVTCNGETFKLSGDWATTVQRIYYMVSQCRVQQDRGHVMPWNAFIQYTNMCVLDIHVGGAWESKSRYGLDRMLK